MRRVWTLRTRLAKSAALVSADSSCTDAKKARLNRAALVSRQGYAGRRRAHSAPSCGRLPFFVRTPSASFRHRCSHRTSSLVVREIRASHCPIVISVSEMVGRVARFPHSFFVRTPSASFRHRCSHRTSSLPLQQPEPRAVEHCLGASLKAVAGLRTSSLLSSENLQTW